MSKNSKPSRAKSGGSLRPLGAMRLTQGTPPQHNMHGRNDPALLINQLQTLRASSPPNNQLLKEKEREFKILYESYVRLQDDLKDQKRRLRKIEAREQKLKDHIASLEKLIAELRFELKTKNEVLEALKKTLDMKIKYYEEKLAERDSECANLKVKLESSEADVNSKQKQIDSLTEEYEKKLKDLQEQHDRQMKLIQEQNEADLRERDNKLEILKKRMAETIGKNSNERQQQLEELKKDLIKASQEAKDLHKQLKHIQMNPPKCSNCAVLEAQLDEKSLQVRLKDKTINDLQNIGKSMQLQLHQQDVILTKWEEREKRESRF